MLLKVERKQFESRDYCNATLQCAILHLDMLGSELLFSPVVLGRWADSSAGSEELSGNSEADDRQVISRTCLPMCYRGGAGPYDSWAIEKCRLREATRAG